MSSSNIGLTSNFSANQISGCYLWLDASTSNNFTFSSGSNISTWIDRSGNNNTATAGNSPTYDSINKRIRFNSASSQYMSNIAAPFLLSQRSFFLVIQEITNTNVCGIMPIIPNPLTGNDYQTTTGMSIEGTTGVYFYQYGGSYANKAVTSVPIAKAIYGETFASLSGTTYINGATGGTSNTVTTFGASSGYGLGGRWANGMTTPYFNGYFHEVIVFNNALSTSNRQLVEGYLAWKWGLRTSLPITHPYYNNPVYSANMPNVLFPLYSYPTPLFQPTFLSNCTLWLDSADRSTLTMNDGLVVSQWRDKSGLGNHGSSVGTIRRTSLIGSLPAMTYPGTASTYFTGTLVNSGTTLTVFSVFLMNSSSYGVARILSLSKPGFFDYNNTAYTAAIQRSTNNFVGYRNNTTLGTILGTFGSPVQVTTLYDGTNHTIYMNGTAGTTVASSGSFGYSNYEVGTSFGEESLVPLNGSIGEVLTFNSALSTTQRQQIEGYLAWKWGLVGTLPANHPYKSNQFGTLPPFPNVPIVPKTATNAYFSPRSISGIALWIDAADTSSITTSGTTVTAVSDKSGTGKTITVTNTVSYSPKQALLFTNTSGVLNLSGMPFAPYDILTVATANSVTNVYRTLLRTGGAPGTHPFLLQVNTDNAGMWDGSAFRQFGSLTLAANEKGLFYATMASDRTMRAAKNGTESLSASTPAGNESQIVALGNLQAAYSGAQPFGTLQEIIIYSTTLSAGQRQQVEGYLAWKWGLVASLPSTHPFKLFPPAP